MVWIHELSDWPNFTWDCKSLASKLAEVRYRQGYLLGSLQRLGFEFRREACLKILTDDVVTSSAIEGEHLSPVEVRSSIARRLGIDQAGLAASTREVDGMVDMMLDATRQSARPLTQKRLCDWHAALFPTGRSGLSWIRVGDWRSGDSGKMQVVSGAVGKEKVHFEAPSADRLHREMQLFLQWFESDAGLDMVIKAGIAHFWFVTIHPFEDGNGRIARAIGDMVLTRADGVSERYYSLSKQIEVERKEYYLRLEQQQREGLDITFWLEWFLDCLGRSIAKAEVSLQRVLFKAQLWEKIHRDAVNGRQRKILNRMLEDDFQGTMTTSKYSRIAKCSADTALRDIRDLQEKGIFILNTGRGRSTSYSLSERL